MCGSALCAARCVLHRQATYVFIDTRLAIEMHLAAIGQSTAKIDPGLAPALTLEHSGPLRFALRAEEAAPE
jgi:hypothetical protein